jgi:hypothetical protein
VDIKTVGKMILGLLNIAITGSETEFFKNCITVLGMFPESIVDKFMVVSQANGKLC